MAKEVIVYSQNQCKYCGVVKNYLADKGVQYEERNLNDPEKGTEYDVEHMEYGFSSVPVTVIDGVPVVGFDLRRLNELLD